MFPRNIVRKLYSKDLEKECSALSWYVNEYLFLVKQKYAKVQLFLCGNGMEKGKELHLGAERSL